ncbi:head protein [Aeromonas jandaei]|uniref:Mu-like prophage major head subunit gpT family protein n=1 Tax=Aeromonas jandaei TaxID=650 RepID=UPI000CE1A0CF|nr:Mu-like prophage major head subunit gpT family protein [Aeromonas jandaei]PPA30461.1 head protein [Aeromonas jandaei]
MIVNKANIQLFFVNLKTTFQNSLKGTKTMWEKVAQKVPSDGKENHYGWLSDFPEMREWIGEKVLKALSAFKYTVENKDWEATIVVKRNDLKDDQTGQYVLKAQSAGRSGAHLPDRIVAQLVNEGFSSFCFDGQYFFDTDHPVGAATFSNKGTKKFDISTLAKAQASYGAARAQMQSLRNEEGEPLGITPNILLVPVALEDAAKFLMTADKIGDEPNIYKGTAEVVVWPRLKSDSAWYLLDTNQLLMPFLYQEREAPHTVEQTGMDSDDVFMRAEYKFGVEARAAGGYGLPQCAFGSTGQDA